MPVTSQCPRCEQLLRIARRKVGTSIGCPNCGVEFVAARYSAASQPGELEPSDAPPSRRASRRRPLPLEPGMAEAEALVRQGPPRRSARAPRPVLAGGGQWVVVARSLVYLQASLLLVVGVLGFASGMAIGRRQATSAAPTAAATSDERISFDGRVAYTDERGKVEPDTSAIAIIVPVGSQPRRKVATRGLRPDDAHSPFTDNATDAVRALGGDVARASDRGVFQLVLPKAGEYLLLVVSSHAVRPAGATVEDQVLSTLNPMFDSPSELFGNRQYRWTWHDVKGRIDAAAITFPR